jgi:hypothetical protein
MHGGTGDPIPKSVVQGVRDELESIAVVFSQQPPQKIRELILDRLRATGWTRNVRVEAGVGITVTALKDNIALCLQFGNVSRAYADLLKLQHLYRSNRAAGAILIVPTKEASLEIGSNIAHAERVQRELKIFRDTITVPIAIVGVGG